MMMEIDSNTIIGALQLLNTAAIVPVIRYVVLIERRLTRLETFIEAQRLCSRHGDPPA